MTIEYADLSEESPGMVLIYGPSGELIFQHAPGNGYARHVLDTDAKLREIGDMRPAGGVYNFALQAAAAKWLPTHRHGTITSIDRETDTCDLTLTACTLRGQNLNQSTTLSSVPVEYMTCDSAAFDLGDEVLIQFNTQNWNVPRVVGFKADPQPCPDGIILTVIEEFSGRIMTPENIGYIRIEGADTGSVLVISSDAAANYWDEEKQFFVIPISPPVFPEGFVENYYIRAMFADATVPTIYPRAWRKMQLPPTKVHVWYESADPDDYTGDPIEAVPKGKYTIHCIRWNAVGRYIAEGEMEFGKYPYHHIAHAPGDRTVAQFVVESSIPFRSRAWFRESGAYSTAITEQTWYTNHHMIGEESGACVDVGYQEAIDNFAMWKFDVNGKYTGRSWGLVTTEGGVIYDIQSHECGPDQTDPITIYSALEIEWQAPRTLPSELALEIAIGFSHSYACESYWQYLKAQTYLDRINVAVWRD